MTDDALMGPKGLSDEPFPAYLNGIVPTVVVHDCMYAHRLHTQGDILNISRHKSAYPWIFYLYIPGTQIHWTSLQYRTEATLCKTVPVLCQAAVTASNTPPEATNEVSGTRKHTKVFLKELHKSVIHWLWSLSLVTPQSRYFSHQEKADFPKPTKSMIIKNDEYRQRHLCLCTELYVCVCVFVFISQLDIDWKSLS